MSVDVDAVRRVVFRLLEEDEEFRYAVAAKLGLAEILDEIRRIWRKMEQHDQKFNQILEKMEEHDRKFNEILKKLDRHEEEIKKIWEKLEEHNRKFNEILERLGRHEEEIKRILQKLEEHDKKFNEMLVRLDRHEEEIKRIWEKLEEHNRKFNEILVELREHRRRLDEHEKRLEEIAVRLDRHERMLGSLGEDIGVLSEAMLARFVRDDMIDLLRLSGARVLEISRRKVINGYEVDLYVETEDEVIVVEVKMRPSVRDVERLVRVRGYLVEKKGKRVRAVLASYHAKTRGSVVRRAEKEGIELAIY